ncbi:RusA family crossover junction endodeoxyribonuclease [Peptoniphilus lacrimalis]|uniref:RusA family crossover junction endodeoxyribonuclease n=1 Tax=Peptoniphilus lacrimalis TaxID=33031 RepID=UPI00254F69A7|nr:RusA family crossover junction endodeoxyribonuclease [Peptoniphilus lacrimalis]MDK7722513.1 RusA family crossover junction endodeoxyribonuclease [Peptoniphilus lacrimalis]MDK7732098.1 RusA family crossover junction endodeoxyribonuclease [Peptoniphilus lacrimalis]
MHLILYGRPITKKNSSRIVKCGNYHRILPSKAYEKYEKECLLQITGKYKLKLVGKYNLKCLYYMPTRHRVDLVNLLEATCDILVAGHVIADDNSKIIVSHDGSRVLYDKVNPRVEIFLEEVVSKNGQ